MEQGEGAETTTTIEDPVPDKKKVKIRCGMFFDGTLNNRTNIEKRLIAVSEDKTTTKKLTDEELAVLKDVQARHQSENDILEAMVLYDQHKSTKMNDDNSYEAFFSNVVKLERHLDTEVPEPEGAAYQHKLKVYVEGSGSIDKAKDETAGFAFAKGAAGIEKKVDSGLERALKQIKKVHKQKADPIELLTLDVIGFSRGAAAARYFIHRALYDYDGAKYRAYQEAIKASNEPDIGLYMEALKCLQAIKAALQADDYTVGEVKICFAGLFDTVSSFGYTLALNSNNTEDLSLDAVMVAEETVHLASADEHRTFFSLTDIASAGGKGREVYLPGVHSDIGGGYRDDGHEKQVIYFGLKKNVEADRQKHIDAGWYTPEEIELEPMGHQHDNRLDSIDNNPEHPQHPHRNPRLFAQLRVNRPGIRSQYNRIPLHLMAGYARGKNIVFKGALNKDEKVPDELIEDQKKIQAYVSQHDALGARTSKAEDWHDNLSAWLRELRGRYFHFSAHYSSPTVVGHIPRIEGGQRIRGMHRG